MFELENDFSWKIRQKRAKQMLTKEEASSCIGISRRTYSLVETGQLNKVTRTVYEKLVNWLLDDKEAI
ncbi:helix-turn-helix domain-containing protein [Vagococcus fluvialis]|uniref:helix-turn-helix domain-containing protein n=1 Tax=Vagococcus fluvialis TaxID=2738 RepID=UPI0037B85D96